MKVAIIIVAIIAVAAVCLLLLKGGNKYADNEWQGFDWSARERNWLFEEVKRHARRAEQETNGLYNKAWQKKYIQTSARGWRMTLYASRR